MAIELHCSHCNHLIKAPDEAAGRMGKCPHCAGANYIPKTGDDELDLVPLDNEDEKRRSKATMEDAAYQRSLLHEKVMPGEPGAKGAVRRPGAPGAAPVPAGSNTKEIVSLIVRYVDAMSAGKLPQADEIAGQLGRNKTATLKTLDEMAREDLSGYGLPALPKPVLNGFLKQLHSKL
jgi:phage FluMu protein Com